MRRYAAVGAVVLLAGCGGGPQRLPQASERVDLEPADFTTAIDNPWWPMAPGSRWLYAEGDQRDTVTVTRRTRTILGISARVVHDVATEDGQIVEDTYDWYAQDEEGNIWYLGEDTSEFEHGKLKTTEGSWQAGKGGAQPGVVLPARPRAGLAYRQEHYAGHAEDRARILGVGSQARVPYGSFSHLLATEETTPLEPRLVERKFYARGVGPVLAFTVRGGSDREVLLRFEREG